MVDWEKFSKGFLKDWFQAFMDGLNSEATEETKANLMEYCGRACARNHAVELFQRIKKNTNNLDEFLIEINKAIQGTKWEKMDDHILSVEYEQCFCPLVTTGLVRVDLPTRCFCSLGWLKENLELVLEKPVNISLEKSFAKGDSLCKFKVEFLGKICR